MKYIDAHYQKREGVLTAPGSSFGPTYQHIILVVLTDGGGSSTIATEVLPSHCILGIAL